MQSLFKKFSQQSTSQLNSRMSVEAGKYSFQYLIDARVVFLTLTEKGYPKKLAFQYLEELANEFGRLYGPQVDTVSRPYAFIKFGEGGSTHACNACQWLTPWGRLEARPSCKAHSDHVWQHAPKGRYNVKDACQLVQQ